MAEVMAEDSSDVFEINDFTNASPWERFSVYCRLELCCLRGDPHCSSYWSNTYAGHIITISMCIPLPPPPPPRDYKGYGDLIYPNVKYPLLVGISNPLIQLHECSSYNMRI